MTTSPQLTAPNIMDIEHRNDADDKGLSDHRSRTAALRRAKMRGRLMEAAIELYQPPSRLGTPQSVVMIDDLIVHAGVSRGSFYKYFTSVDDLVTQLGEQLVSEAMGDYERLFAGQKDAIFRAIGGSTMALARGWHQPPWAGFTCRINYVEFFEKRSGFGALVRGGLRDARAQGDIDFTSLDAAVDLTVGATIEGRRRMMMNVDKPKSYAGALIYHIYSGLGLSRTRCEETQSAVWQQMENPLLRPHWWSDRAGWA